MKKTYLLLAVFLIAPIAASAADLAKIEVYAAGVLQHSVSFQGANSSVKVSSSAVPNTTLELRLIAPEPLIVEVKETITGGEIAEAVGRVKLLRPGSSFAVSEIKGGKFHSSYLLVRQD
ncbi:MAG: hypothetical protein HGA71_15730 [Azonexaceae bacterium]|nr:hypothetical protein [Azonexaceae bacterium]